MKINTTNENGKDGINTLIILTKPKEKTEQEIYKDRQEDILRGIFEK